MTPAEIALWKMIKNKQLKGERFLRQFSIDNFVVDFYSPKYKLAIELDGQVHFNENSELYDEERTKHLNSLDIKVIRFENFQVFDYPLSVLDEIAKHLA